MSAVRKHFDHSTFWFKKKFFKNDLSVTFWTFIVFFSGGILSYWLLIFIGNYFPLFGAWEWSVFLPFWTTAVGLFLTWGVLLKINIQKTETGTEFIDILIGELSLTKHGEEFVIIIPNINLASYLYKSEFNRYLDSINSAKKRGVKIKFLTLGIDPAYFNTLSESDKNDISKISLFFKEAKSSKTPMLTYLYNRYSNVMNLEDYKYSYDNIKSIMEGTELICLKDDFADQKIVGFYSSRICYIGKYGDLSSRNGEVIVRGETVSVKESLEVIDGYLIQGLTTKFKLLP